MADSDSTCESSTSSDSKPSMIDKILGEMKSQFNRRDENDDEKPDMPDQNGEQQEEEAGTPEGKPRIVLLFKKPAPETPPAAGRRSLRHKSAHSDDKADEPSLKRSARRRSKDFGESVLQSAIARKEKSYNESNKPQRLTRQLKPTQKILENLALAKQEKIKSGGVGKPRKNADSDPNTESETKSDEIGVERVKKHKHKHGKHAKRLKRIKKAGEGSEKGSDSDQSHEENGLVNDDVLCRRSRRISSSKARDDQDVDESNITETIASEDASLYANEVENSLENDIVSSRLCHCARKTQYFFHSARNEEVTYCGAVDSINEKAIGCSRVIDPSDAMLLRPSTRIPYTPYCSVHKSRLMRHNCCPTCGRFCTQGVFAECEKGHQYHRACQISVGNLECCPHCGGNTPESDINIKMTCSGGKRPVFLPVQKVNWVSAKMSFQSLIKTEGVMTPPLIPVDAFDLDNSFDEDEEFDIGDLVAAVSGNEIKKVAAILASKSVDISSKISEANEGTILHLVARNGFIPLAHLLLISGLQSDSLDRDLNTALMVAILQSQNEMVEYLISAGAGYELRGPDGMCALHLAAKTANLRACELLLRAGNGIKNFINCLDDGGWTPLVWACEHGHLDTASYLIFKGADPRIRDGEHNVALHWAAFSGSAQIVELLLNQGCEVNAVNAHGDTPLHIGARQDMYNCIIVLLSRGADVTLLNKNNESALDCVPPGGDCYNPIQINIALQACGDYGCPNVILSNDISKGREPNPIQCYNNVDSDPKPIDFCYITKNCQTSDDIQIDTKVNTLKACKCEERCVDDSCACGKLSVRCWYDEEGKLIPQFSYGDIPMIFECNDSCDCNIITCNNRVVQKGSMHRFELFKTLEKGWGIRSLRAIAKGAFVCEYIGEIVTDSEADSREDDTFLFDLENRVNLQNDETDTYCIDAKYYGNFARFINHSCSPNLTSVKVFVHHQDLRFPRIGMFANRDIACDEELCFDYGEKFWMAKFKTFTCVCGVKECKYSKEAIEGTLRNYQSRIDES